MLLLLGCVAEPATKAPTRTDDTGDTGGTTPTECAADPDQAVLGFTVTELVNPNEIQLEVTLAVEATAAVACTLGSDAEEVHLVESPTPALAHTLRIGGLLGDETYTCAAAPLCPGVAAPPATLSHTTGPVSRLIPAIEVEASYDATEYILFQHSDDCDWAKGQLLVVDRAGRVRWWYEYPAQVGPSLEFRYHGDDRFVWGGGWSPNEAGRPRLVDLYDGEVYDSAVALPDFASTDFHHDGKLLPDGRYLTLEQVPVGSGRAQFLGFQVRAVSPDTNTVDFTYDSQRALDEGHLDAGDDDAWHANWVDISDDTLYVSLCFVSTVAAIDTATGDWVWSFGKGGDFTLLDTDGAPLSDSHYPQCQHGLEKQGDRLLVYDNGTERGYSRAVEYQLDEAAMTATRLWEWTEPDWYETTLGDVDWLPDGGVLVTAGHAECFSSNPGDRTTVYDLDPDTHEKRWEMSYTETQAMAYRADWADPCELFANTKYCAPLAQRWEELAAAFEGG